MILMLKSQNLTFPKPTRTSNSVYDLANIVFYFTWYGRVFISCVSHVVYLTSMCVCLHSLNLWPPDHLSFPLSLSFSFRSLFLSSGCPLVYVIYNRGLTLHNPTHTLALTHTRLIPFELHLPQLHPLAPLSRWKWSVLFSLARVCTLLNRNTHIHSVCVCVCVWSQSTADSLKRIVFLHESVLGETRLFSCYLEGGNKDLI